jgi:GNAT superfamily N-acetyltransferase
MIVDEALVRRLEASAARATLQLVDRMRSADGVPFGDGALIAMGAGRYVNRAMGVTLGELSPAGLDQIEQFFTTRGLPSMIEVSSWANTATVAALAARQYTSQWFRGMYAIVPEAQPADETVTIEEITDDTLDTWMNVLAEGNQVTGDDARRTSDEFASANRSMADSTDFLAFIDGNAVGSGSLQVIDGIGWVGGAATLPSHRGRGVQTALLRHRLHLAARLGCELVAATAIPSGASARNMHRLGFTHVQTQVVMAKPAAVE